MTASLTGAAALLLVLLPGCASNKHAIYNSEYADRVSEAEARLNERVELIQRTCTDRADCDRRMFEAQTRFEAEREQYESERDERVHASNRKGVDDSVVAEAMAAGLKGYSDAGNAEKASKPKGEEEHSGDFGFCSGVQPPCVGDHAVCVCDSLGANCHWGCPK